jgi:hypothetical protein
MSEALDDLRRHLRADRLECIAAFEAGLALLSAGRELIRIRDDALGITQAQTATRTGQRNEGAQSDAA